MVPDNALTIEDVVTAINQHPPGAALLVTGDFNAGLAAPEGHTQDEVIPTALSKAGLDDTSAHFILHHKPQARDRMMWSILCGGLEVPSRTNYILVTDRRLLQNVAVQDTQHITYH